MWYGSAGYASTEDNVSLSGGKSGKLGSSSGLSKTSSSNSKVSKVGRVNGGKGGKRGGVGSTSVEGNATVESTSEEGWSTGDGWHSATGGRRLSASWGASAEVKESPEIVWVGSAQTLPQASTTAKTEKVEVTTNAVGWGSSVSSVSSKPQVTAKTEKVESVSNVGWGSSVSSVSTKPQVTAKTEKVETASNVGWGASVSTVKAGKPVSSSSASWGSSVSVTSSNAPTICQTVAEASPTMYPTEAPTSCSSRFAIWYFNTESGRCVNDDTDTEFLVGDYESMDKCCEATFSDEAEYAYCKLYLYEDKCCSMENHLWFYDSLLKVCTNDITMVVDNENTEFYSDDFDCCKGEFSQSICPTRDVCIPELPETIVTAAPSKEPTPAPSAAPTTCADLYSVWYYDVSSEKCVTGMSDSVIDGYGSVDECCDAQFSDEDEYEFCKEYLQVDTCCLLENHVWHFDGEVCTNGGFEGSSGSNGYDEDFECCIAEFKKFPCPVKNICIPELPETVSPTPQPSAPEIVTSVPTVPEVITMEPTTVAPVTAQPSTYAPITPLPTEMEIVTLVPTTSPITAEPTILTPLPSTLAPSINEIMTVAPTFGSTPVSVIERKCI